ncbi:MAG: 8-amino-7-oxononanoate synthase [Nitrospirae bacterium CG18_big_fil_WC_8_21_14_2_50_70_55]|nr:8-amino-7-oxononanoate synthase [Deltaproteobacteria bacterium]PIQ05702.1 MAG: 8-amino-7-oxononanoate synthase [Nitrospirae bacterium CG18_big_fil_WC_8_21_14_2_50_70_55]
MANRAKGDRAAAAAWRAQLDELAAAGLARARRRVDSIHGPQVEVAGRRLLQFCSNNYLDLASHPRLIHAAAEATRRYGTSAVASPLVCGHMAPHAELEETITRFKGAEAALVVGSGFLANLALLTTLAGDGDRILCDRLNHASILDGARLSKASLRVYPHCDLDALERLLRRETSGRTLIVTDSVFSMDGDLAPLDAICDLADRYGATVVVDDAHATGVIGDGGRGSLSHFGLAAGRAITMGTLGKALASYGAFIAGPKVAIDLLVHRARPLIYSTALPPAVAVVASEAIHLLEEDPGRVARLAERATYLRQQLATLGVPVANNPTPIVPLVIGEAAPTVRLSEELLAASVWIPAIRPPTVPAGTSRLRIVVSAGHSTYQIDYLVAALRHLGVGGGAGGDQAGDR